MLNMENAKKNSRLDINLKRFVSEPHLAKTTHLPGKHRMCPSGNS